MCISSQTLKIISTISSVATPVIVLVIGLIISKKLEKKKLEVLKEKEWQVKWSELFLLQAIDFNDNISKVVCSLFNLQFEKDKRETSRIQKELQDCLHKVTEIEWNIKNYTQFAAKFGKDVESTQKQLMDKIRESINDKQGDLEVIRKIQFEYNQAVKNAHAEMLRLK